MVKRVFADSDLVKWVMTASEEEVIDVLHNVHHGIQQECVWQYHFLKHECFGDDYVARIKELQSEVAMKTAAVGGMDYVFNGAHSILANKKLRPLFIVALLLISKPRLTNRCSK